MDNQFLQHDSYAVGLHFATKIMVRHVVVSLDLNGETLARDLEANADVFEQPDQVVGHGRQGELPADPLFAPMPGAPLQGDLLDPAERFFDALADPLTDA